MIKNVNRTHIYFYQGRWYDINQFVAWEQGKLYMPKQARLNRFYSNYVVFDKFITTKSNTPSVVSQNTCIAAWNNGKYAFGKIKRLIKLPVRGKSAYPIFHWDKTLIAQDVEMAIQLMLPIENLKKMVCPMPSGCQRHSYGLQQNNM